MGGGLVPQGMDHDHCIGVEEGADEGQDEEDQGPLLMGVPENEVRLDNQQNPHKA